MRINCRLFGCLDDGETGACVRCGTDLYSVRFRYASAFGRLRHRVANFFGSFRCGQCRKFLGLRRERPRGFCSAKCYDEWIPF